MKDPLRWVLFGLMFLSLPAPYFMFVIAGLLPLVAIAGMMFTGVWGFKLVNGVILLVYCALYFWIAGLVSRALGRLTPPWRWSVLGVLAAGLLALTALPIYGVGHGAYAPTNLLGLRRMLL